MDWWSQVWSLHWVYQSVMPVFQVEAYLDDILPQDFADTGADTNTVATADHTHRLEKENSSSSDDIWKNSSYWDEFSPERFFFGRIRVFQEVMKGKGNQNPSNTSGIMH